MTPARLRGIAGWTLGSLAAVVGILVPQLFLLCAALVLLVRVVVLHSQRDEAHNSSVEAWFAVSGMRSAVEREFRTSLRLRDERIAELDAEAERLHLALTEAQIAAGTVRVPLLRVVPASRVSDDDWFARLYDEKGEQR